MKLNKVLDNKTYTKEEVKNAFALADEMKKKYEETKDPKHHAVEMELRKKALAMSAKMVD